jgi:hypothetical protein
MFFPDTVSPIRIYFPRRKKCHNIINNGRPILPVPAPKPGSQQIGAGQVNFAGISSLLTFRIPMRALLVKWSNAGGIKSLCLKGTLS